ARGRVQPRGPPSLALQAVIDSTLVSEYIMSDQTPNSADPRVPLAEKRTGLASFRTRLALDRTTLAWVRTTLTMTSFGFGMVAFFRTLQHETPTEETIRLHTGAVRFGVGLIVLGLVATVLAGLSHWFTLRRLNRGEEPVMTQWPLSITVAMFMAILFLGGLWLVFMR
ncbi:MAG TPA: DUF202 domain-containing protein, partial [Gemmatales bacterium]|nr:DUF202 domain-containing protein [Gemmatales bacterium]